MALACILLQPPERRGDLVDVLPAGADPGAKVRLPRWGRLEVTDATVAQVRQYTERWIVDVEFSVQSHDPATDVRVVRVEATNAAPNGTGRLDVGAKIRAHFQSWGFTLAATGPGYLDLTAIPFALASSAGMWGRDVDAAGVVFSNLGYQAARDRHRMDMDVSATGWPLAKVEREAVRRGFTVLQSNAQGFRLGYSWATVRRLARFQTRSLFDATVRQRRYRFPEAVCAALEAAPNGFLTTTRAQAAAAIRDLRSE